MNVYGKTTQLGHASKGPFTAAVSMSIDGELILRITPGTILSEANFELWFPDFTPFQLEAYTAGVSLYTADSNEPGLGKEAVRAYFPPRLKELVEYLDGIQSGSYFY